MQLADSIAPPILRDFPGYCWGKVIARGLDNRGERPEARALLRAAEAAVRARPGLVPVVEHPAVAAWRAAFQRFGARPSKYQSSVEALVRRAQRGDELPYINTAVALYNALSLQHLLPLGGDDLERVTGPTTLRYARGDERFVPLGASDPDPPEPGEVVYADAAQVLCRRWCWRGAEPTKITAATRLAVFNVHGLPPTDDPDGSRVRTAVEAAARELAALLERYCGGETTWYLLDAAQPARVTDW